MVLRGVSVLFTLVLVWLALPFLFDCIVRPETDGNKNLCAPTQVYRPATCLRTAQRQCLPSCT